VRARVLLLKDYACDHAEGYPVRPCMVPAERVVRSRRARSGFLTFCAAHFERRREVHGEQKALFK
jgi:hypothetical protein